VAARASLAPAARRAYATSGKFFSRSVLAASISCVIAGSALAGCEGHDLYPPLQEQSPEVYTALEENARIMPFGQGTLFRLEREGEPPSFIFGMLHLTDSRATAFSQAVLESLSQSKTLALETIVTGNVLKRSIRKNPQAMRNALFAQPQQKPDVLLDKTDFASLETLLSEAGFEPHAASRFKPSILALLLDLPLCAHPAKGDFYADERIAKIAREQKKPVVGLETMLEQITILDGLTPQEERDLLLALLRQAPHAEDMIETTLELYQKSETGKLLALMQSPEAMSALTGAFIPPEFITRLINQRNNRMRERILPLLSEGGAFIAVGVLHLPGEFGLLNLLKQDGYKIEKLE
jgi:uncharacterized protein YbaP (TraB family)